MRWLACVLLVTTTAHADEARTTSDFSTLERVDGANRAGLQVDFVIRDGVDALFRLEPYGQYVESRTGLGLYGAAPIAIASGSILSDRAFELGNFELGGLWAKAIRADGSGVVVHGGVMLPTAPFEAKNATAAGQARIASSVISFDTGVMVRVGVSGILRHGRGFARLDVGYDVRTSPDQNPKFDEAASQDLRYLRVNAGAGFAGNRVAVSGELAFLQIRAPGDYDSARASLALSVRGTRGWVRPVFALAVVSEEIRSVPIVLSLGADARF